MLNKSQNKDITVKKKIHANNTNITLHQIIINTIKYYQQKIKQSNKLLIYQNKNKIQQIFTYITFDYIQL